MDHEHLNWKQLCADYLEPLRASESEAFVQGVMRKVRTLRPSDEAIRWSHFARWAFPALAFSMTSFLAAFVYTMRPVLLTTDVLLSDDRVGASASLIQNDPLLEWPVAKQ